METNPFIINLYYFMFIHYQFRIYYKIIIIQLFVISHHQNILLINFINQNKNLAMAVL